MTSGNCKRSSHHVRCSMWIYKIKPQHFLTAFFFCIQKKVKSKERKEKSCTIWISKFFILCFRVIFYLYKKFSIAIKNISLILWVKNITFDFIYFFRDTWLEQHLSLLCSLCNAISANHRLTFLYTVQKDSNIQKKVKLWVPLTLCFFKRYYGVL